MTDVIIGKKIARKGEFVEFGPRMWWYVNQMVDVQNIIYSGDSSEESEVVKAGASKYNAKFEWVKGGRVESKVESKPEPKTSETESVTLPFSGM